MGHMSRCQNNFVCHFSAGVGRTGVFITLSIVLERMQYEGVVDVFQVKKMFLLLNQVYY
jgi:protein tyrosine phosphatase